MYEWLHQTGNCSLVILKPPRGDQQFLILSIGADEMKDLFKSFNDSSLSLVWAHHLCNHKKSGSLPRQTICHVLPPNTFKELGLWAYPSLNTTFLPSRLNLSKPSFIRLIPFLLVFSGISVNLDYFGTSLSVVLLFGPRSPPHFWAVLALSVHLFI